MWGEIEYHESPMSFTIIACGRKEVKTTIQILCFCFSSIFHQINFVSRTPRWQCQRLVKPLCFCLISGRNIKFMLIRVTSPRLSYANNSSAKLPLVLALKMYNDLYSVLLKCLGRFLIAYNKIARELAYRGNSERPLQVETQGSGRSTTELMSVVLNFEEPRTGVTVWLLNTDNT